MGLPEVAVVMGDSIATKRIIDEHVGERVTVGSARACDTIVGCGDDGVVMNVDVTERAGATVSAHDPAAREVGRAVGAVDQVVMHVELVCRVRATREVEIQVVLDATLAACILYLVVGDDAGRHGYMIGLEELHAAVTGGRMRVPPNVEREIVADVEWIGRTATDPYAVTIVELIVDRSEGC